MKNGRRSTIKVCLLCQRVYLSEPCRCGCDGAYYAWRIVYDRSDRLMLALGKQILNDVLERLRIERRIRI